jgi:hypothetical protein
MQDAQNEQNARKCQAACDSAQQTCLKTAKTTAAQQRCRGDAALCSMKCPKP